MTTPDSQSLAAHLLETCVATFRSQKILGDKTFAQLDDAGLFWAPEPESNSVAVIVKHVSGNMVSRWTDFLTTDGEKPGRNRDEEFADDLTERSQVLGAWEQGWDALFGALAALKPEDLSRTVTIRGEPHSVVQAIQRQVSHYGYHVGQIVYAAKAYKSADWQTLSIARNRSAAFNEAMKRPRE